MINFKCKMCGGTLSVEKNQQIATCEFCGTTQTLPVFDDEKKTAFYNRANALRLDCQFDKAAGVYETLVVEYPKEAEAYWGLVLCKYGIEYVDDKSGVKIPICHKTRFESIFDDADYQKAVEYANVLSREIYIKEVVLQPCNEFEKLAFKVPNDFGDNTHGFELSSISLTELLIDTMNWTRDVHYRVCGRYIEKENIIVFPLTEYETVTGEESEENDC